MCAVRQIVAATAVLCGCAGTISAQDNPTRVTIDGTIGVGLGWGGGNRVNRSLVVADLLAAVRLGGGQHDSFLAGLETISEGLFGGDKVCVVNPRGGCVPGYPSFEARAVVGGREWQLSRVFYVRAFGGPGYYRVHFTEPDATNHSIGARAGADIAVQFGQHVAAMLGTRGSWIPKVQHQSYLTNTHVIGLRLGIGG